MATVEALVRDIISSVPANDGIGGIAVARWVDNRYKELVAKVNYRHLRKLGELSLSAEVTTGTLVATRGSTTITGTSTTFETEIGSGAQTDWYIRPASAWYEVASVGGETAITLSSDYAEDTISTAKSYHACQRYYSLASDARWIGGFLMTRLQKPLEVISIEELDSLAPGRTIVGSHPAYVSQLGVDSSNNVRVEVYPPPKNTEILHYVYWSLPTELSVSSTIPDIIDDYTLKEGVLIDVYQFLMNHHADQGNVNRANLYANQKAQQRTVWRKARKDAARTQRGVDDTTFIIQSLGGRSHPGDIKTARDQILSTWSY